MKLKFLTFCIVFVMMLSQFAVFASAISDENSPSDKIDSGLAETMEALENDDYVKVNVWLENYGDTLLYAYLSDRLGQEITQDNEGIYVSSVIAEKVAGFEEREAEIVRETAEMAASSQLTSQTSAVATGNSILPSQADESNDVNAKIALISEIGDIPATMNSEEVRKMVEAGKSYEEIIDVAERNRFLSEWRNGRSTINKSMGNTFKDKLDMTKCRNIEIDPLLSYVSLECKKSYISEIAAMSEVKQISEYRNIEIVDGTDELISDSSSSISDDTSSGFVMTPQETLGYTGSGVRVGVLEYRGKYNNNYCNPNASHLSGKTIVRRETSTSNFLSHATKVMSIIAGSSITLNGVTYCGIAPDASLYLATYTGGDNELTYKGGLYWLIVTKNVSVINMSLTHGSSEGKYTVYDQYIDCLISEYRVTIIKSAGNYDEEDDEDTNTDLNVTDPGLAYNAITVGSVSNEKDSNDKYIMASYSCYNQESHLPNKPDISAFGSNIHMIYNNALTDYESGTSFAAPMVTGTVALMMEANPSLIGKPDAIKAMLINSADNDAISTTSSNSTVGTTTATTSRFSVVSQLKEKSGAGLLNIERALSMASSNMIMYRFAIPKNSTTTEASFTIDKFYLYKNKTVEATLVFEKAQDNCPTSLSQVKTDFDLEVYDYNESKVASSASSTNNVEAIRLTPVTADAYTFKIKCNKLDTDTSTVNIVNDSGVTVTHQTHDYIYMTFILSCVCDRPSANVSDPIYFTHDIKCSNCGVWAGEVNAHTVKTVNHYYVTIKFDVYYKIRPFYNDIRDIVCLETPVITLTPNNSSHAATYSESNVVHLPYPIYYENTYSYDFHIASGNQTIDDFSWSFTVLLYYSTRQCTIFS